MSFRTLDATHIIATIERLGQRIEERFPGAGLSGVGRDLLGLARDCARRPSVRAPALARATRIPLPSS
jgi:hypothetical protein